MVRAREKTLFEDGDVKITTFRAIIRSKTYALADITSVEMGLKDAPNRSAVFLVVASFLILAAGILVYTDRNHLIGLILLLLAGGSIYASIRMAFQNEAIFIVRIRSLSGESIIFESADEDLVEKIVDVMNDAIVKQGR